MDLNFSAAEVTVVTGLLVSMAAALGFMTRNLLAAKQETIDRQGAILERQEATLERDAGRGDQVDGMARRGPALARGGETDRDRDSFEIQSKSSIRPNDRLSPRTDRRQRRYTANASRVPPWCHAPGCSRSAGAS